MPVSRELVLWAGGGPLQQVMRFTVLFLASLLPYLVAAQDDSLATTNQWRIQSFWNGVQASNGPVTVMSFGDSVSDDYLSIQKQFFWRLQNHFGSSGIAFAPYFQGLGGGAAWSPPNSNWWTFHASLPPGGYAVSPNLTCDRIGLFWIAHPQGGAFTLGARTNGGLATAFALTLSGFAASPVGCYTNVLVPRNAYLMRLDGLTGTNTLIGVQLIDRSANGISTAFMSSDGQSLGAILATPTNIFYPILSSLNPQLVVWHMKEVGDPGSELLLSNGLVTLESRWQATVTNGDVVYLGTPYDQAGSAERQNPVVRQSAVRDHRAYVDCMTPCISFDEMAKNGCMRDPTHPSDLGNSFLANTIVWPQLDLARLETRQPLRTNSTPAANPIWLRSPGSALPVYGWASSTAEEATLVLFNPSPQTGYALLDCQAAFALPSGAPQFYDVCASDIYSRLPLASLYAGQPTLFGLNAAELVALEAHPALNQNQVTPTYAPVILAQPVGQARYAGAEALFSARAWGTPPFFCQWRHDGNVLPGKTSTNLLLTNLGAADAGSYSLTVTNSAGAITSAPASLSLLAPPPYSATIIAAQPVAYWRLDETRGPTIFDSFSTNDGASSGHVTFHQFGALPYTQQFCLGFDGTTNTKVDAPYATTLNLPAFSVECWVQASGSTNGVQSPLASRDILLPRGYFFQIAGEQRWTFQLGTASGWRTNYGPSLVPGKWTFLTGTFDGTNQSFYVDGQLASQAATQLLVNSNRPLRFGAGATESSGGEYFMGKLDEVALFDYALTSAQVNQHYQSAFQVPASDHLSIQMVGPNVMLLWPTGQLEHADSLAGPWSPLPGVISPQLTAPTGLVHYYRLGR